MNIKLWIAAGAACAVGFAFAAGHHVASLSYERQMADFKAQAQAQYAQALEAKAVREKYLQGKIDESASNAKQAQSAIEERYQKLLDAARSAVADVSVAGGGADADRVHESNASAGGQGNVPSAARASSGVQQSGCQCARTNGAKLRKLYEDQLTIARDCDITAAHYNELIDFYESARTSMQ